VFTPPKLVKPPIHPELKPGEQFCCNTDNPAHYNASNSPFKALKSFRLGNVAYDIYGVQLTGVNALTPVFVAEGEFLDYVAIAAKFPDINKDFLCELEDVDIASLFGSLGDDWKYIQKKSL
jgi:hypothetical protein